MKLTPETALKSKVSRAIKFTIIIPPVGQMRARSRAVDNGERTFAMTYKAGKQRKEERRLAPLLYEHRPTMPIVGPVLLGVKAFLPIPASCSKKFRAAALAGLERPTKKPDLDNLIKHLKDLCNGVFWGDDKQVVGYLPGTGKYYGDPARWEIEIVEFSPIQETLL